MDKLQEIENRYLIENPWAYSSYIDLVHKEDVEWLIQSIKTLREVRISDGNSLIEQANEIDRLKAEINELKKKSWYPVYRENLELAQKLEQYKKGIEIKHWSDF